MYDRVRETTITSGTGAVTLLGAAAGYQSFGIVGNGNTCYYCISDQVGSNWEVGIGTYTLSGTTLSRITVLASSNSGSLVSFGSNTKDVFLTCPANVAMNALFTGTASVTVGNTGTETSLMPAGIGSLTIPANFLIPGKTLRVKLKGYYSTTTVPGNVTANFKLGGTTVVTTGADAAVGSLTNLFWEAEVDVTCVTVGSSGTAWIQGKVLLEVAALGCDVNGMTNTTTTTLNTTTGLAIDFTWTWGTANASNTITLTNCSIELVN
jgi:hypothetical protein